LNGRVIDDILPQPSEMARTVDHNNPIVSKREITTKIGEVLLNISTSRASGRRATLGKATAPAPPALVSIS
jgi:hypothetical protein